MLKKFYRRRKEKAIRAFYGTNVVLRERIGARWLLRASNYIDRKLWAKGSYESEQLQFLFSLLEQERINVFIDVGANIGLYSILVAKRFPDIEEVIALEPQRTNYNQLCGNIFLNGLDQKIKALCLGASDVSGTVDFLRNTGDNTGTSRVKSTAPTKTIWERFETEVVQVTRLDDLLTSMVDKRVCFKIDVEGHEEAVLKGMSRLLRENRCIVQMEILPESSFTAQHLMERFSLQLLHREKRDYFFKTSESAALTENLHESRSAVA